MSGPLVIVAHVRAKPGFEEQMVAAQKALVAISRSHAGCLRYELNLSDTDKGFVMFVEQWASRKLWHQHMDSQALKDFRDCAGQYIGGFEVFEMHQVA